MRAANIIISALSLGLSLVGLKCVCGHEVVVLWVRVGVGVGVGVGVRGKVIGARATVRQLKFDIRVWGLYMSITQKRKKTLLRRDRSWTDTWKCI